MCQDSSIPDKTFFNYPVYPFPEKEIDLECLTGNNQKGLLLVSDVLSDDLKEFLKKILAAIQCSLEEDCLLHYYQKEQSHYLKLKAQAAFRIIILFGHSPQELGLNLDLPKYRLQAWKTYTLLYVDSIEEIQNTKKKKVLLWQQLQKIPINE